MFYFKQNGEKIEKYRITFNKKEVKKLQDEIIDHCSIIKHVNFESDYIPKILDNYIPKMCDKRFLRNLKYTRIGQKEYFEETRDIYSIEYDRYIPSYLVEIIERILNGDSTAIEEMLHYQVPNSTSIEEKINLVNSEMISIPPSDIAQKKQKLEELENLLKHQAIFAEISSYYEQLISLFKFEYVASILTSELERVKSFLAITDITPDNSHVDEMEKILKKYNKSD